MVQDTILDVIIPKWWRRALIFYKQ
jgi:hypothetical protein